MARTGISMRSVLAVLIAATAVSLAAAPPVAAQGLASFRLEPEVSAEERAEMYATLRREVAELERHGSILKMLAKLLSPTVVHIDATKTSGSQVYGRSRVVEETGSGVIIQRQDRYFVVTNRHVIRDAKLDDVDLKLFDGRVLHPAKVWTDEGTDVAVMELKADNLTAAEIGSSSGVEIGDFVVAIGSPFGLSHSVTYGIISAKGRRNLELGEGGIRFQDFMQTDAAINPGNSGGPLVNLRGEVIGINTAIASESGVAEGVGFSIPIDMAMNVVDQLIEHGSVQRAFLGVTLDSNFGGEDAVRLGLPVRQGARVLRVTPESPAEIAHLQVDDVILYFNGKRVENDSHLVNIISLTPVRTEVPMIVFRGGEPQEVNVTLSDFAAYQQRIGAAQK